MTTLMTALGSLGSVLGQLLTALLLLLGVAGCTITSTSRTSGAAKWEVYAGVRSEQVSEEPSEASQEVSALPDPAVLDLIGGSNSSGQDN